MYDRDQITELFCRYCKTGRKKNLEELLRACMPLIDVILRRYTDFISYQDDIKQDVLVKAWIVFQNRERLQKELENPMAFLMLRLGTYMLEAMSVCAKQYGIPIRLTEKEREVVSMREEGESWEKIGEALQVSPETAQVYHSTAKGKIDIAANVPCMAFDCAQQMADETLDPARRYELKDLRRYHQRSLVELMARHPNLKDARDERFFQSDIKSMFSREVEIEAIL